MYKIVACEQGCGDSKQTLNANCESLEIFVRYFASLKVMIISLLKKKN